MIKEHINKILELVSISFKIKKSEICIKSRYDSLFDYYVYVYLDIDLIKLGRLENILDKIFEKENVGFILHIN